MSLDYQKYYHLNKEREDKTMDKKITIDIKGSEVIKLAMCAYAGWTLCEVLVGVSCHVLMKFMDKTFDKEVEKNESELKF